MNVTERAIPVRTVDTRSPFVRLAELLADVKPGQPPISIAVGEPQHPVPPFVGPVLAAHIADFGRYPANTGTEGFRRAVAGWLGRRYQLARPIDPLSEILVLAGTREGLFLAAIAARRWASPRPGRPAMLIPNPFYAVYAAGAVAADCEPVYLDATAENGFLPDLDALSPELLARTVAFYLASPANPQGSIADAAYLKRLIALARQHRFMVFADECYSEIYWKDAPPGMLEQAGSDFANVAVFHSLSKRSSLPGLRIGFIAGDKSFLKPFLDLRSLAAPQVPVPAQEVAIAAYNDETHVRGEPGALPRQVRPRRPDHRQPLRLQAPGRRLLPLARRLAAGRQRGRDPEALEGGGPARAARQIRRARAGRRLQSGRKLHPHRDGAGPRGHRRSAASSRRGLG